MLKLSFKKITAMAVALAVTIVMFAGIGTAAGSAAFADAASEGFVITDYDVSMVVEKDRTYHITETIACDFSEARHGIYRCIPTSMYAMRPDGSSDKVIAKVKNFQADTDWEEDNEYECSGDDGSYFTVRLGDADRTVTGQQVYTISYDYQCSGDSLKDMDEFYFNIIGTGWNTDIEHVTFSIGMPAKFNRDKVGFSMGGAGTVGTAEGKLESHIEGKTITGQTLETLGPGEALTIRIELPEGYFTVGKAGGGYLFLYLIPIIFALVCIFICIRWGRDEKIIPVIQFNPPEGYNSLDVGVMHHLDAKNDDVLSLLIYLADKGYISIEPLPDKRGRIPEKPKKFRFHKLHDYDGDNDCEREFMNGLFLGSAYVDSDDLEDAFSETVKDIKKIESSFTKKLVSRKGRTPATVMAMAAFAAMCLPALIYDGLVVYFMAAVSGWLGFFLCAASVPSAGMSTGKKIRGVIIMIASVIVLIAGVPFLIMSGYITAMVTLVTIGFLVGVLCMLVMAVCWALVQKRTPLGVELGGVAMGLAEFIETAEKDRLEQMVEEDPQSFYRIIPYAMALGVSDKWASRFRGITMEKPHWYMYGSPYMEGYMIGHMIGHSLGNAMRNASAASAASSGGGGFSGGGVGGGGGGSW